MESTSRSPRVPEELDKWLDSIGKDGEPVIERLDGRASEPFEQAWEYKYTALRVLRDGRRDLTHYPHDD
jgi:hypothetical protein